MSGFSSHTQVMPFLRARMLSCCLARSTVRQLSPASSALVLRSAVGTGPLVSFGDQELFGFAACGRFAGAGGVAEQVVCTGSGVSVTHGDARLYGAIGCGEHLCG